MTTEVSYTGVLSSMRNYFDSGATKEYEFRKKQLLLLLNVIKKNEKEIFAALSEDLKKNPEEAYATETGLVIAEISFAIKRLHKWMRPQKLKTNLLNFPSTSRLYRDPLGVVLIIGSWNYPFQLLISPMVGAIAGGNCAVIKPSEGAPATSHIIAKIFGETFSPDYIRVVEGDGKDVVPAMMDAFRFDHIFYTGSTSVGKSVYQLAAEKLIPVTLELGGKSPAIVEPDADLKISARRIVLGKFVNAGQTCVAPDYLLVHESIVHPLVSEIKSWIRKFYGDDPASNRDYGKIINEKRFDRLISLLHQGGEILHGGKYNRENLYIEPTIVSDVFIDDEIMQEEIFGPLLPVLTYRNREDAVSIINQLKNPLSFYVFSKSKERVNWWVTRLPFGGGCVNNTIWQLSNPHLPFGGVGMSGIGNYHGKYSFDTFTHAKPVMKTPLWFDPSVKYPPFKGKLNLFKKFIK